RVRCESAAPARVPRAVSAPASPWPSMPPPPMMRQVVIVTLSLRAAGPDATSGAAPRCGPAPDVFHGCLDAAAAVDFQQDAGDELGLVGGEEAAGLGDVERTRHAAERDAGDDLGAGLRRVVARQELAGQAGLAHH